MDLNRILKGFCGIYKCLNEGEENHRRNLVLFGKKIYNAVAKYIVICVFLYNYLTKC